MIDVDLRGLDHCRDLETATLSTFKSGGKIALALYPRTKYDLTVIKTLPLDNAVILGNMSNVAVKEGGYDGIAIMTSAFRGLEIEDGRIYVGAGEKLSSVVRRLARLDLYGIERLLGIPATVGGAIYQNAGAFGQEIGDVVEEVVVHDIKQGETYRLNRQELDFSYRSTSLVPNREMVVGAVLKLGKGTRVEGESLQYLKKRRLLQPQQPSLGSTFLKVDGVSAGYYIDECGYKGYTVDGVKVSEQHANFLVNTGDATVMGLQKLQNILKEGVRAKMGITLKEETRIIGNDKDC